ncbi:cytochrome P450 2J6-like [Asterias rubens]|uniref:cytochrome P450 2J6-like n=1 Tax=Asterias rubens TaxID=7604 RepID=UPI0014559EDC|nr:cytochrome P450 2J6-like [Asterias rubens]
MTTKMELVGSIPNVSLVLNLQSILIGLFTLLVLFYMIRRPRNLPPGPIGWPLLGYLPQMAMAGQEPQVEFSRLTKIYGNVVSVNIAGKLFVFLHGYDTIKEAFSQHQLNARPTLHVRGEMFPGSGVISSSGKTWSELRRFCTTVLRGLGVGKRSFEENIATEAHVLITEMRKEQGAPFDPKYLLGNAVLNIICSVVLGKRFQYNDPAFRDILRCTGRVMEGVRSGGIVEFSPVVSKLTVIPFVRRYVDTVSELVEQMLSLIDEHNRDYDSAANPRDIIDMFLKEINSKQSLGVESGAIKIENLRPVVGDLFVAGSETTNTTLRWSMLYMMAYPDVQHRVQKELDDVTLGNRLPKTTDKPKLPYTEAVLCEIQRCSTIVPLAVPHYSSEDTTLSGFNIPKGTIVISNLWHQHHDPLVWEQPDKFLPERFLDKDGNFSCPREFTPFGIGRRICLGEHLAKMELFIFFTFLLHQFTLKNPPGAPPVSFKGIAGGTWAPLDFKLCAVQRNLPT